MYKKTFDNNGLEERIAKHQVGHLIELAQAMSHSAEKEIASDQEENLNELIDEFGEDKWLFYSTASLFSMNIGAVVKGYEERLGRINLTSLVAKELNKTDKELIDAIGDFRKFTADKEYDEDEHTANIGLWVVWNLRQKTPSQEDYHLIAAIGKLQVALSEKIRESLFFRGLN